MTGRYLPSPALPFPLREGDAGAGRTGIDPLGLEFFALDRRPAGRDGRCRRLGEDVRDPRERPQNETYLFGFRKYEQGQNAREIPLIDPLVEAKEKEIARLRVPVPYLYELVPAADPTK
jgi:hypothetical protein